MNQQYPSILLEKAVGEFSKLPGIGRKTAMRLVLHLLRQDTATVEAFGNCVIIYPILKLARFALIRNGMFPLSVWWKISVM